MIEFVAKATVTMLIAVVAAFIARRGRASMRHAIYSAMFALLLLLPLAPLVLPRIDVPVAVPSLSTMGEPAQAASDAAPFEIVPTAPRTIEPSPSIDFFAFLEAAYFAGTSILFLSLGVGIWRLQSLSRRGDVWLDGTRLATEFGCAEGARAAVLVVLSNEVQVPMTFGFRRQTIVLPSSAMDWDAEELHRALCHELEHVRRSDWAMQLVARLAVAVYWPHPLVWIAFRRFCTEAERACDDAVVRSFEASAYASQLLALARSLGGHIHVPALAMASPTRLTERVRAILDATQLRGPQGRRATLVVLGSMLGALLLLGPAQLVAETTAESENQRASARDDVENEFESDDDSYQDVVVKASERGSIKSLSKLLDDGLDVNRTWDGDGTPLLIASRAGKIDAVRFLLSRGADPNVPSPGDGNPLIAAATHGELEIARLLLDRGARIDAAVKGDETPLIGASERGDSAMVRLLIERGADVNLGVWSEFGDDRPREWRTPLNMARKGGHDDVARILVDAGARD
jgi:beta-lactamase regulating signal transducer with metallopeptidase domain